MSDEVHGECPDQGTIDQLKRELAEVDPPTIDLYEMFVLGWSRAKAYYEKVS